MTEPSSSLTSQVASFGAVQVLYKLRYVVAVPVLARLIGATGYGTLAVLMAFAAMVQIVVLMGTNTALTVYIPWVGAPAQRSREFWGVMQTAWGIAAVMVALLVLVHRPVLAWCFPAGFRVDYFLCSLVLIPLHATNHLLCAQVVNNQQARAYARRIAATSLFGLCSLVIGAWRWGLAGVLAALVLEQVALALWVGHLVLHRDPFVPLRRDGLGSLTRYYGYGLAVLTSGAAAWIVESSDRLLIGKWLPIVELGVYQMAYSVCAHIGDLASPLFSALLPVTASAVSCNDLPLAKRYLERSYRMLVLLYLPLVVWVSLEARDLLTLVATPAFARGAIVVPWVAAGVALNQLLGVFSYTLHSHKKGQIIMVSVAVAAGVNVVMNLLFIRRFGIVAAAMSTAAAYATHFFILRLLARRLLPVALDRAFVLRVLAATSVMAVAMLWVIGRLSQPFWRLAASGACGVVVCAGMVCLLEGAGGEARRYMRQIVQLAWQPSHQ